jgi:hypothetical protein
MNFEALLMGLLKDPAFERIIQAIIADMFAKITSGVSPIAAGQQGIAQAGAAAAFHLTGNPVADVQSLLVSLQPHAASPPAPTISVTGVAPPAIFAS